MSENDNVLEAKKIVLTEKEFFQKATSDEMMIFIEQHYKSRKHFNEGSHYCKNIKIHSVEGFTREETNKLYNERVLTDVWDLVILPYVSAWKKDYKYDGEIYTKGRSGGWLYNDKAVTLDFEEFEEKRGDEDEDDYQNRLYPLRNLFEILWKLQKWYEEVLKEVKEFLADVSLKEDK